MAYPEPANVAPWYLRNITQALALNEATGNVYVRTDAQLTIGNAITDGTTVYAQTCSSRSDISISGGDGLGAIQLGRDVNGNTDVLVYAVAWTQPNTDLLWKLAWDEYTNN